MKIDAAAACVFALEARDDAMKASPEPFFAFVGTGGARPVRYVGL